MCLISASVFVCLLVYLRGAVVLDLDELERLILDERKENRKKIGRIKSDSLFCLRIQRSEVLISVDLIPSFFWFSRKQNCRRKTLKKGMQPFSKLQSL